MQVTPLKNPSQKNPSHLVTNQRVKIHNSDYIFLE